jgi:hypothetical protein
MLSVINDRIENASKYEKNDLQNMVNQGRAGQRVLRKFKVFSNRTKNIERL